MTQGCSHRNLVGIIAVMLVLVSCLTGCKKQPEGVIGKETMAQLMADLHIAEAVVDYNYGQFPDDSMRRVLKQSVYAAHGVTPEMVDTSFVWYGNHIEEYVEVYERAGELIKERQQQLAESNSKLIAVSGDSVMVWMGPERIHISPRTGSRIVTFDIPADSTWQSGDIYRLRYKIINGQPVLQNRILVDYEDGATEFADESNQGDYLREIILRLDTTRVATRVYGYVTFAQGDKREYEIDSLLVTRVRRDLHNNPVRNFYGPQPKKTLFEYGRNDDKPAAGYNDDDYELADSLRNISPIHRQQGVRQESSASGVSDDLKRKAAEGRRSSEHLEDAQQQKRHPQQRRTNRPIRPVNNQRSR